MQDDWVTIVEAMPARDAEKAFHLWLQAESARGRTYNEDDFRKDLIRSKDRTSLVRYLVLRKGMT